MFDREASWVGVDRSGDGDDGSGRCGGGRGPGGGAALSCGGTPWWVTPEDEAFVAELEVRWWEGGGESDARAAFFADPSSLADPGSFAEALAQAPGGARLACVVEALTPGEQDEYALVEVVAAWSRVVSWAQGRVAASAAELAGRVAMHAGGRDVVVPAGAGRGLHDGGARGRHHRARGRPGLRCAAAHELALRLCISRDAAQRVIETGRALGGPLGMVGAALETGEIDHARARAFVTGLDGVALPVAVAVAEEVLVKAGRRTARQVAHDIAEALIRVDEVEAGRRHRRAREGRRVHRPVVLPDGMAGIWAVLPALDAVALDTALDGAAAAARAAGDPRTPDQVRADALAAVGHTALAQGWIGGPPVPAVARGRAATPSRPSRGDGVHGAPGTLDRGGGESFLLGEVGGRQPHVRVTVPLAVLIPDGGDGAPHGDRDRGSGRDPGSTGSGGCGHGSGGQSFGGCGHDGCNHDGCDHESACRRSGDRPAREVPRLDGYGPVTPEVARAVALGGVWTRLVTDPLSGVVRDVGRSRYRPPAGLAELVRVRDRTCVVPGCGAPAQGCELDHTVPYHLGGRTSEDNLASLCPAHHALKSAGVGRIRLVGPAVYDHELPSGHRYRREADGTSTPLTRSRRTEGWTEGRNQGRSNGRAPEEGSQ